jgi:phosphoenolpyruvate-protein kinase (PTS system EI component)
MDGVTRRAEVAENNEQRKRELVEYQNERAKAEQQLSEMQGLVARLGKEKEAALSASAQALIENRAFDISVLTNLDNRLAQAQCAAKILHTHYVAQFERFGPAQVYEKPGRRHSTL